MTEHELETREKIAKNLAELRKRAEHNMLPAPTACSLIVEIQMYLEQLWGCSDDTK